MTTTTFRLAPPVPIGLALALAAAALVGFGLLRLAAGARLAPARRWGLVALRAAILGLLGAILLNPVRVEETPGPLRRARVDYLIDASESMALGPKGATRWDRSVAAIRDAAAQAGPAGPEVAAYRFGSKLSAIERPPWLAPADRPAPPSPGEGPTEPDTLLAGSLETLAERLGAEPPGAVVVFSDGRARDADRVEAIARGYGQMNVPIHVVPAGASAVGGDVAIVSAVVPRLVRKSTRIAAQVFVRSYGYAGRRAEIRLSAAEADGRPGAVLARAPIALGDGLATYTLAFESGEADRRIVASIEPQPGEVSADNNSFAVDVGIDHTKIRILYLEGSTEQFAQRRGMFGLGGGGEAVGAYASLQKALMEDPDIECTAIIPARPGDFGSIARSDDRGRGLPETPSELYAYDAIILSDVPRSALDDRFLGWIDEWIGRRGGGLCMVGGPRSFGAGGWAGTAVGSMLPVAVDPGPDWAAGPAALAPGVPGHPLWHIAADVDQNRSILKALSPFEGRNRLGPAKANAEVLARAGTGDEAPALAVQPFGRGRTMALDVGITRRLAPAFSTAWGQGDARYYRKFWRNAAYWLTENSSIGRRRLLAEADKRLYRPGESVVLKARAFDENAASTLDYRIAVSIEPRSAADATSDNAPLRRPAAGPVEPGAGAGDGARTPPLPWGEEFELTRLAADRSYEATLPILTPAEVAPGASLTQGVRIELTAYENNTQVDSTAIDLQILDDPAEQQNPLPDHDVLRRLAERSGGRVLDGPAGLASALAGFRPVAGPPEVRSSPAWSRPWLLVLLIGLLAAEWAWRRRLGLA